MGRRKKNTPVRKQDTFMSICKISGWLLFFIIITGIFTIIATNNLFEKHNVDLVGIEPNYSYSDFVAEGFSQASLNAVAIIFVCLGVTFVLKYILHCKIDCTPIAVASCFIFIFYTAYCFAFFIIIIPDCDIRCTSFSRQTDIQKYIWFINGNDAIFRLFQ